MKIMNARRDAKQAQTSSQNYSDLSMSKVSGSRVQFLKMGGQQFQKALESELAKDEMNIVNDDPSLEPTVIK